MRIILVTLLSSDCAEYLLFHQANAFVMDNSVFGDITSSNAPKLWMNYTNTLLYHQVKKFVAHQKFSLINFAPGVDFVLSQLMIKILDYHHLNWNFKYLETTAVRVHNLILDW